MKRTSLAVISAVLLVGLVVAFGGNAGESFKNSVGLVMLRVEPGTFTMGAQGDRDHWTDAPPHQVALTQPFYISETEVTTEAFREFRRDFRGNRKYEPYAAGVSWHEASAFCEWLSRREGKPYRLSTEAEWEYVARAGWQPGVRPQHEQANPLGVKNMLTGAREWCWDWFGEYSFEPQTNPVGPASGFVKIVRGGALDLEERNVPKIDFYTPQSRLAVGPAFGVYSALDASSRSDYSTALRTGLVGLWFDNPDLTEPQDPISIERIHNSWNNDPRGGGNWSALWVGEIHAPATADVTFQAEADTGVRLRIGTATVIDGWGRDRPRSGSIHLTKDRQYPIEIAYYKDRGESYIRLFWSWPGQNRELVPASALTHTAAQEETIRAQARIQNFPGEHCIGFRIVQAPMPATPPSTPELPLVQRFVKQTAAPVSEGPDAARPYFRKRYLLPTPLENSPNEAIDAVGMHPSFRRHNHSPGLEVLPNGDVLLVIYTSYQEYEPGVSLIASRLRFGADEWDFPSRLIDEVGVNDHAPLLWKDSQTVSLFWGHPKMEEGAFPFQWISSTDSGATWSDVQYPKFTGPIGDHTKQPINSGFRGSDGTIYAASDGSGGRSVLWASRDNGKTWYDTGGRSAGRHTTYVALKDGSILGIGGKNTNIDGFMPQAISRDGGRTWDVSKSPFPPLGTNQRPTLVRLESGRLLFAGDYVLHNDGSQPAGINQLGCYVALSEDEGKTWRFRRLIGAQLHEDQERAERMKGPTLGYSVARQAPNGMIHLIATMNSPCLHFEFNEAWILNDQTGERSDKVLMASSARQIPDVRTFEEKDATGKIKARWSGGRADDGRFLLHGSEAWFWPGGGRQYEVSYELGRKVGKETVWRPDGSVAWSCDHDPKAGTVRTEYWPNGQKKSETTWQNFHAKGIARVWDPTGKLVSEKKFENGKLVQTSVRTNG